MEPGAAVCVADEPVDQRPDVNETVRWILLKHMADQDLRHRADSNNKHLPIVVSDDHYLCQTVKNK